MKKKKRQEWEQLHSSFYCHRLFMPIESDAMPIPDSMTRSVLYSVPRPVPEGQCYSHDDDPGRIT